MPDRSLGAGKTTTLRILLGLDRDFEGSLATAPDLRIGMVFQEPRLLPWRSVEENVRLSLPRPERGRSLDALFDELGLASGATATRGRSPSAWPGGSRSPGRSPWRRASSSSTSPSSPSTTRRPRPCARRCSAAQARAARRC